jgi:hypothetical protein
MGNLFSEYSLARPFLLLFKKSLLLISFLVKDNGYQGLLQLIIFLEYWIR